MQKGRYHLGNVGIHAPISNNGLESKWRHIKDQCGAKLASMEMPHFIWGLFKYIPSLSEMWQAKMRETDDPYNFPNAPVPSNKIWYAVQRMPFE